MRDSMAVELQFKYILQISYNTFLSFLLLYFSKKNPNLKSICCLMIIILKLGNFNFNYIVYLLFYFYVLFDSVKLKNKIMRNLIHIPNYYEITL